MEEYLVGQEEGTGKEGGSSIDEKFFEGQHCCEDVQLEQSLTHDIHHDKNLPFISYYESYGESLGMQ